MVIQLEFCFNSLCLPPLRVDQCTDAMVTMVIQLDDQTLALSLLVATFLFANNLFNQFGPRPGATKRRS